MKTKEFFQIIDKHISRYGIIYILISAVMVGTFFCMRRNSDDESLFSNNRTTIGKIIDIKYNGRIDAYRISYKFNVSDSNYFNDISISNNEFNTLECSIGNYFKVIYNPVNINNNKLLINSFVELSNVRKFFNHENNPYKDDTLLLIDSIGKDATAIITDSTYSFIGKYSFAYKYEADSIVYEVQVKRCSKLKFNLGEKFKIKYLEKDKEKHYFYFYEPIKK